MKVFVVAGVVASSVAGAAAQYCANAQNLGGNYYCSSTTALTYVQLGGSGSYNEVTGMDKSGKCSTQSKSYGGSLAPFDEDLSVHIRGPIQLKQFAVYQPGAGASKVRRNSQSSAIRRRHAHSHGHAHNHMHAHEKRDSLKEKLQKKAAELEVKKRTDVVVATVYEEVVEFVNAWFGKVIASAEPSAASAVTRYATSTSTSRASSTSSSTSASATPTKYYWERTAYYNAGSNSADGLVFLNNKGGSGSGVFDNVYGNSLSYAASNGVDGAASPQVLGNNLIASNVELSIWSGAQCDGSCGFSRPGTVAHKGWAGTQKAFFFEFAMPSDGKNGFNMDMPSVWLLNGRVSRTSQYPKDPTCSCWKSGCGELDLWEVLDSGNTRCKSTVHNNQGPDSAGGGSSYYFNRPTGGTVKAAAIFDGSQVHVQILDSSTSFDEGFTKDVMTGFCKPGVQFNINSPYS